MDATEGGVRGQGTRSVYARVSTLDQNLALQQDALKEARCEKTFVKQMSRAVSDRPALPEALDYARSGDTLIVWKLDRLARSMKQLIETIEKLRVRNIGFRSLTEAIDTTTAQGRPGVPHVQRACGVRAGPHSGAARTASQRRGARDEREAARRS